MRLPAILPALLSITASSQAVLEDRQAVSSALSSPSSTSSVFVAPTGSPAPTINSSSYDLSQHFCRIYRHASVYADGKIYIDGGNTYTPRGNTSFSDTPGSTAGWTKGMNNNLLVLDLSQNFTNQDTFPYSSIHKGPDVPSSLIEHTLWYSAATRKIYQLGGWFSSNNVNDPGFKNTSAIPESAIWQFDMDAETWSVADDLALVNTGTKIDRPGAAANCDAPSLNMSFVFEGYVQQRSDHDYTSFTQSSEFKFLEGMLALDTSDRVSEPTLTNVSVPRQMMGQDFGPRMNGAMVHVPVGDKGIVVQIGGQTAADPTPYGIPKENANAGNINIPLSYVDIFDIETGYWFRQETFGLADGIPTGRSDICAVMVPAKDESSFNIYMIAGVETYATFLTVEEIWVLTLPTFQWTLVHTRSDGMYGHTCHAVGENLVIVGGMQTKSDGGDVQTCSQHMPAEIFSLATQEYTGLFDVEGAERLAPVPSKVVAAIGGTTDGGAYVTSPKVWSDLYLQYIFNPSLTRPAYTPTYVLANSTGTGNHTATSSPTSDSSSGANKGAVVGGAVGGTLGAALIAAITAGLCLHRRKTKRRAAAAAEAEASRQSRRTVTSELPAPAYSYGMVKDDLYAQQADMPMPAPAEQTEPAELYDHNHPYPYPPDTPEIDSGATPPPTSRFQRGHAVRDSVSSTGAASQGPWSSPGHTYTRGDMSISPTSQGGFADSPTFRPLEFVSGAEEDNPALGRRGP